jgi:hypothetical protein
MYLIINRLRCEYSSVQLLAVSSPLTSKCQESFSLDTVEERDILIQNVYPKLRQYCLQKYNVQFQVFYSSLKKNIENDL